MQYLCVKYSSKYTPTLKMQVKVSCFLISGESGGPEISVTCSRPVSVKGDSLIHSFMLDEKRHTECDIFITPSATRYATHQPSHHTRILRLLFSGLQAAAPGVVPASFPAAALIWWL